MSSTKTTRSPRCDWCSTSNDPAWPAHPQETPSPPISHSSTLPAHCIPRSPLRTTRPHIHSPPRLYIVNIPYTTQPPSIAFQRSTCLPATPLHSLPQTLSQHSRASARIIAASGCEYVLALHSFQVQYTHDGSFMGLSMQDCIGRGVVLRRCLRRLTVMVNPPPAWKTRVEVHRMMDEQESEGCRAELMRDLGALDDVLGETCSVEVLFRVGFGIVDLFRAEELFGGAREDAKLLTQVDDGSLKAMLFGMARRWKVKGRKMSVKIADGSFEARKLVL